VQQGDPLGGTSSAGLIGAEQQTARIFTCCAPHWHPAKGFGPLHNVAAVSLIAIGPYWFLSLE
jgi:hypothetical protein